MFGGSQLIQFHGRLKRINEMGSCGWAIDTDLDLGNNMRNWNDVIFIQPGDTLLVRDCNTEGTYTVWQGVIDNQIVPKEITFSEWFDWFKQEKFALLWRCQ